MTAPGPAQPPPGAPASPAQPTPGAPTPPATGSQVDPPAHTNPPTSAAPAAPTPPVPAQTTPVQTTPAQSTPAQPAPAQAPAQPAAALPVPATATAKPPAPARPKTSGAYLVAVFALLIAVLAAGTAAYSLKIAMDVRDENATAPLADPTADPETSASPERGPAVAPTETAPPAPDFIPELVRAELRVPNPAGCAAAYVDVDTGNVGVESGHEFYLSRCQVPTTLQVRVDRTSGRSTSNADPSPETCSSLIAGTPTSELVITAQPGVTFCLLTNQAQATAQNLPQRLAILEVLTVSTTEIRLALSTYRVEE